MAAEQRGDLGSGDGALRIAQAGGGDMRMEVIFDQFVHQAGHGPAHRRHQVQRLGTVGIGRDGTLNGSNLPGDPPDTRDDLFLAGRNMCHNA